MAVLKTVEDKKAQGTFRTDRFTAPVDLGTSCPSPPEWLDKEARQIWEDTVPALHERLGLSELDQTALAVMCMAQARYIRITEQISIEGETVEGPRGTEVKHPACAIRTAAYNEWVKLACEYGLTAKARGRIHLADKSATASSKSRFFNKGQVG